MIDDGPRAPFSVIFPSFFSLRSALELPMSPLRFPVSVIFERTALINRWVSERWEPLAVIPPVAGASGSAAPVKIGEDASRTQWRFDGHALRASSLRAEGYYLNLVAPEPKAFVMWRMTRRVAILRCSGDRHCELQRGGRNARRRRARRSVPLPMDPRVDGAVRREHYKPEPRKKVRRNDPFADGAFAASADRATHGRHASDANVR
jgi:hypothetical protein